MGLDSQGGKWTPLFGPRANVLIRGGLAALVLAAALAAGLWIAFVQSDYYWDVRLVVPQPVPFSHRHHVAGLGIDCRFCHSTVTVSSFAGMPSIETCMNCHSQVWTEAPVLEPLRQAWRTGQPLGWRRVHNLPDYVYFNHSIHLSKGVGCESCHGRVDEMALIAKAKPLNMRWCIDCHEHPEKELRPKEQLFAMGWKPPLPQIQLGTQLLDQYHVQTAGLTNCTTCHR